MLKGQAALLWGVLGEAHSLLAPSRDPTNLEAAAPTAFLRGAATEGARGRWSKLTKQLLQAAKERKARTFSEAMPSMVAAPGMGAFTFAEPAPKTARGDEGVPSTHIGQPSACNTRRTQPKQPSSTSCNQRAKTLASTFPRSHASRSAAAATACGPATARAPGRRASALRTWSSTPRSHAASCRCTYA